MIADVREAFHVLLSRMQRCMHGVVREVQEERLCAFALQERDSAIGQHVGEIRHLRGRFAAVEQWIGCAFADVVVRVRSAKKPQELVEAALHRVVLGIRAKMPLAKQRRAVAGRAQAIRQRPLGQRQAEPFECRPDVDVELVPETLRVAACQQARAGRTAVRAGDVAVGESDASGGERIDIGRHDVAASVHAKIGVSHVVGDDDEDVCRLTLRVPRTWPEVRCCEDERDRAHQTNGRDHLDLREECGNCRTA